MPKTDHDLIVSMHTALCGVDGQDGLVKKVNGLSKSVFRLWLIVIGIIASMGGGAFGILKIIGGV